MITNSRLRAWRDCPRKEYLSFELRLEPLVRSEALRWGSAFHAALAGIPFEADPFVRASVSAVVAQYNEPVEIVAREEHFEIPLVNPDTGEAAKDETLAGTIDAIGRLRDGRLAIVERKTTSRPVEDLLQRLDLDTQVLTYWIGARAVGYPVEAVFYAVQPKPQQRPLKATPEDKRKYTKAGELYANQRLIDETPDEYAARLTIEAPTFREVPILHDAIENHQRDLWAQYTVMRSLTHRWRNPAACEDCHFVPICNRSDLSTTVPDGYFRTPV